MSFRLFVCDTYCRFGTLDKIRPLVCVCVSNVVELGTSQKNSLGN
jgi:hypothetical protein